MMLLRIISLAWLLAGTQAWAPKPIIRTTTTATRSRQEAWKPHCLGADLSSLRRYNVSLQASSSPESVSFKRKLDVEAIGKYSVALAVQMSLFGAIFVGLDKLVAAKHWKVPFYANCALFYAAALKSRVLNPLANNRPKPNSLEVNSNRPKRKMPSWTPPGFVFPIMWLLIVAPIRAATASMVYDSTASYACPALFSFAFHLACGDVWNTINNVERRYGVAVWAVYAIWLSKAFAAYQFYQVNKLAGKLLGYTLIWITIAAALVTRTWRINPDPETGKPDPLYPATGKAKTRYSWFGGSAYYNE